ncbi:Hypothetical protein DEACI_1727 [Acididesulfobacillus acetoxydans]|uniref:Uncharacterized protein n=1 Tax=Acididesulfobacillus acetoxydans TaxID=1561005 RepID=A0ABP1XG86_9FIRM|nr:Hypothetical protein DEACI_1727 [Acididesulfobacillus acetoxydans]
MNHGKCGSREQRVILQGQGLADKRKIYYMKIFALMPNSHLKRH